MARHTLAYRDGWPIIGPAGRKEQELITRSLVPGEVILGQVIGAFGQTIVATDQKGDGREDGVGEGRTVPRGRVTTFDYRNLSGVEVRTRWGMGKLLLIGPAIPAPSGAGRSESPNVIGFASRNAEPYQAFAAKVRERPAQPCGASTRPQHRQLLVPRSQSRRRSGNWRTFTRPGC